MAAPLDCSGMQGGEEDKRKSINPLQQQGQTDIEGRGERMCCVRARGSFAVSEWSNGEKGLEEEEGESGDDIAPRGILSPPSLSKAT